MSATVAYQQEGAVHFLPTCLGFRSGIRFSASALAGKPAAQRNKQCFVVKRLEIGEDRPLYIVKLFLNFTPRQVPGYIRILKEQAFADVVLSAKYPAHLAFKEQGLLLYNFRLKSTTFSVADAEPAMLFFVIFYLNKKYRWEVVAANNNVGNSLCCNHIGTNAG